MLRKGLLVVAAASAVAVPTTVAVAGGEEPAAPKAAAASSSSAAGTRDATTTAAIRHKLSKRAGGYSKHAMLLRGLAQRLGTSTDELRIAGRSAALGALDAVGRQTGEDVAALRACIAKAADCDRRAARTQARALHREVDVEALDLAAIKQGLAEDAAEQLGTTPEEVLAAVRAELDAKLSFARTVRLITAAQRELALGCFDRPDACDVDALHRAFRFRGAHRRAHG